MNNTLKKFILKKTIYIYKNLTLAYALKNHFFSDEKF